MTECQVCGFHENLLVCSTCRSILCPACYDYDCPMCPTAQNTSREPNNLASILFPGHQCEACKQQVGRVELCRNCYMKQCSECSSSGICVFCDKKIDGTSVSKYNEDQYNARTVSDLFGTGETSSLNNMQYAFTSNLKDVIEKQDSELEQAIKKSLEETHASPDDLLTHTDQDLQKAITKSLSSEPTEYFDPTDYILEACPNVPLLNTGNSCYINSVLQIFLHSEELYSALRTVFPDANLLMTLKTLYTSFAGIPLNAQDDSGLFLNWLLDKLEAHNKWFKQESMIKLQCLECGKKRFNELVRENYIVLHPSSTTVDNCIDLFNKKNISTKVQVMCDACGKDTKHKKTSRFTYIGNNVFMTIQAVHTNLAINEAFDIYSPNATVLEDGTMIDSEPETEYELRGFIVHRGNLNSGHYIAFIDDNDEGYTMYSDDLIVPVSKKAKKFIDGEYPEGYSLKVLWYVKVNPGTTRALEA